MSQALPPNAVDEETARTIVLVCYLLGAIGLFTGGLFALVALIVAYIKRGESQGTIYASHYEWMIKTFWIGIVGAVLSFLTFWMFGLGWLIYMGVSLWLLFRYVKGFLRFMERRAVA